MFGRRAGISAGKCQSFVKEIDTSVLDAVEEKISRLYDGEAVISSVRKNLKSLMWNNVGIYRNELDLKVAEREISRMQKLPLKISSAHEIADAFITENMLITASLVVSGALLRRESRGAHTRTDIKQKWTADNSPFGHTWFAGKKAGIDIVEANL